jgi:ABC-type iron transport system FetAB permease component
MESDAVISLLGMVISNSMGVRNGLCEGFYNLDPITREGRNLGSAVVLYARPILARKRASFSLSLVRKER